MHARCTECSGELRAVGVDLSALQADDEGVKVLGSCGHTWTLTEQDKQNLRSALANGMAPRVTV
jgi:hypothetical protein